MHVPNVAKRSTWEQCIYILGPTTDRPTSHFGKFRMAISRQRVIRSTTCLILYGRGFKVSGSNGATYGWKMLNDHYFCNRSCDSLRVLFYGRVFGSADRMSLLSVGPNPRSRPSAVLYNFEWPYLWNGSSGPIRIWFWGKSVGENNMREE